MYGDCAYAAYTILLLTFSWQHACNTLTMHVVKASPEDDMELRVVLVKSSIVDI